VAPPPTPDRAATPELAPLADAEARSAPDAEPELSLADAADAEPELSLADAADAEPELSLADVTEAVPPEETPSTEPPAETEPGSPAEPPVSPPQSEAEPARASEAKPARPAQQATETATRVALLPDAEPEPEVVPTRAAEPEVAEPVVPQAVPAPPTAVAHVPDAARPATPAMPHAPHAPDPSDYSVHDGSVTVQAAETLGHYAEWLEVRASDLRRRNRMRYEQPLVIGSSVTLDFSRVTPEEFELRRLEHHRTLQSEFFDAFEVTGTETHVLRRGESPWYLAERKYRIPLWLLRQYNPELDFANVPAGSAMVVPLVEPRAS
jgi:membrane-bound lytic murein transglycosylase D